MGSLSGATNVFLLDVPDYDWWAGCFGTATGNLMGYWDRNGFPNFYTGPTAGGVAPLNSRGGNYNIRSMWVSSAGRDGRPASDFGHEDDYYLMYENADADPYLQAGRAEHTPDCIGDFIGLNQNKWKNQNGECDGNIDGFSFNFWDASGERRVNYTPKDDQGNVIRDIQHGLRAWTEYRGSQADVFSQLAVVNPKTPAGKGFTYADLVAEIEAGFPVLVFLQDPTKLSMPRGSMVSANPEIHGMLMYGYYTDDEGGQWVRIRNSWGSSDQDGYRQWGTGLNWTPSLPVYLPVRGVIGYHPKPRILQTQLAGGQLKLRWEGPASWLRDELTGAAWPVSWYVVEKATSVDGVYAPETQPTSEHEALLAVSAAGQAFYRLRMVPAPE